MLDWAEKAPLCQTIWVVCPDSDRRKIQCFFFATNEGAGKLECLYLASLFSLGLDM